MKGVLYMFLDKIKWLPEEKFLEFEVASTGEKLTILRFELFNVTNDFIVYPKEENAKNKYYDISDCYFLFPSVHGTLVRECKKEGLIK
jgi:hypothetical protein